MVEVEVKVGPCKAQCARIEEKIATIAQKPPGPAYSPSM